MFSVAVVLHKPGEHVLSITVRHAIVGLDHRRFGVAGDTEALQGVAGLSSIEAAFLGPAAPKPVDVAIIVDQQHA
jgi:hypothetical protein